MLIYQKNIYIRIMARCFQAFFVRIMIVMALLLSPEADAFAHSEEAGVDLAEVLYTNCNTGTSDSRIVPEAPEKKVPEVCPSLRHICHEDGPAYCLPRTGNMQIFYCVFRE